MRVGDVVLHRPSGETWVLGGVDEDRNEVYPCGWPQTIAKMTDCLVVEAACNDEHWQLVEEIVNGSMDEGDIRKQYCRRLINDR